MINTKLLLCKTKEGVIEGQGDFTWMEKIWGGYSEQAIPSREVLFQVAYSE